MAKRFELQRAKQIVSKDSVQLLSFTAKFYRMYMNPLHRWLVLFMFKRSAVAKIKGRKRLSAFFQYLSQFIQAFAGYSVTHVSKIPPKIDIYSMGTRLGLANFFWKRQQFWLVWIFCLGGGPEEIDTKKQLIVSNYREGLNLPETTEVSKDQDSVLRALPLKQV